MLTLCILLGKVLHIYYKGIIFVSEIKQDQILVVFNDLPELTYEVWDRYKVGYHDYDVHQYEIGLKK